MTRYLEQKGFHGFMCKISDEISPEHIPAHIETAAIARKAGWRPFTGPNLHVEAIVTGPRWSADATDDEDGLKRLPAGVNWNVRAGWILVTGRGPSGSPRQSDLFLRVANLFDQRVDWQVGLPGPGRTVGAGVSTSF